MPRVNLLIADDTGLGKTIEAGLVIQELLARARIRNCLVVCPASLQTQWKEEMEEKFDLELRIIDRDSVLSPPPGVWRPREFVAELSPAHHFDRLPEAGVGTPEVRLDSRGKPRRGSGASRDLLVLDEAHNCAPSGGKKYTCSARCWPGRWGYPVAYPPRFALRSIQWGTTSIGQIVTALQKRRRIGNVSVI